MAGNVNKLDKSIKIGNESYDIQATVAGEVENILTIKESALTEDGEDATFVKTFNGSQPVYISVVSAENGGHFKQPISVPPLGENDPAANQVINYGDITSKITSLTGSGWYTWDGNTFASVVKNSITQHLGIVLGTQSNLINNDGFAKKNQDNKYLPKYLYICSDTDNLYYGDDTGTYRQIVNEAKCLTGNVEGVDDTITYTVADIYNEFITFAKKTDVADSEAAIISAYEQADAGLLGRIDTNQSDITTLEGRVDKVISKTDATKVNKAIRADRAMAADNAALLNNKSANDFQKKITVSKTLPSNPTEGDICIIWQ